MDRILKTLIESYAEEFDEESTSRSETFESFSSYSILENQAGIDVNPQDHLLAGGNDIGIDAAAIIINGKNVTGKDRIYIRASYYFRFDKRTKTKKLR